MSVFKRFGDYPIANNTGLPNINIPLYAIEQQGFTFPISMNFHASGRRTNLNLSTTGVGWAINATGYISREIRQRPDEYYFNSSMEVNRTTVFNSQNGLDNILTAYNKLLPADMAIPTNMGVSNDPLGDAEHDIYSYNINGISGKFVIGNAGLVKLTSSPIDIKGGPAGGFIITDEKGIKYLFNTSESVDIMFDNSYSTAKTGWYLDQIVLPSEQTITFHYASKYTGAASNHITAPFSITNEMLHVGKLLFDPATTGLGYNAEMANFMNPSGFGYDHIGVHAQETPSQTNYTVYILQSIDFSTGVVLFNYSDYNKLLNVDIVTPGNSLLKRFAFDYYDLTPGTLSNLPNNNSISVKSLDIKDSNGSLKEQYKFTYYDDLLENSDTYDKFSKRTDWWGYSNNDGTTFPIDGSTETEAVGYGCSSCKTPRFNNKRSGMLKTITYPTNGITTFVYEPNYYQPAGSGNPLVEGPGIRIQQIVSNDGVGNQITKNYTYGDNGEGQILYSPNAADFVSEKQYIAWADGSSGQASGFGGSYRMRNYSYYPVPGIAEAYQQPIYYNKVTESVQSLSGNMGKTVSLYTIPQSYVSQYGTAKALVVSDWDGGQLIQKLVYRNDNKLLEDTYYEYETLNDHTIPQVRMSRNWFMKYDDSRYHRPEELYAVTNGSGSYGVNYIYDATDFPIRSGVKKIKTETKSTYDEANNVNKTINQYDYANLLHLQPTRITMQTSKGDLLVTENTYAGDLYDAPGGLPTGVTDDLSKGIYNIFDKHILSPVESTIYRVDANGGNKRFISSSFTTWKPSMPVPDKLYVSERLGAPFSFVPVHIESNMVTRDPNFYQEKVSFDEYDNLLNLLQDHKTYGTYNSYIWGYGGKYPVAEIRNGDYSSAVAALGGVTAVNNFRNSTTLTDNEVRTFLAPLRTALTGASITTFTYKPLVGMTSLTNAKGETTYYDYDLFQRLKNIKDKDQQVTGHYDYHYQNQ